VPGDQLRIEVEVLALRTTAVRMGGKAYVGEKLACEAIVTCVLVDRPHPGATASRSKTGTESA